MTPRSASQAIRIMSNAVSIVDYGVGNINSVANMLRRAGADVTLAKTPEQVVAAPRVVLPGVGAFDSCRAALDAVAGLETAVREFVKAGRPMLGICVGMQLLATDSEEGVMAGLDIIPGRVRRFTFAAAPGQPEACCVAFGQRIRTIGSCLLTRPNRSRSRWRTC